MFFGRECLRITHPVLSPAMPTPPRPLYFIPYLTFFYVLKNRQDEAKESKNSLFIRNNHYRRSSNAMQARPR
jgi:hypothetical protein